jgi:hypothetical protein
MPFTANELCNVAAPRAPASCRCGCVYYNLQCMSVEAVVDSGPRPGSATTGFHRWGRFVTGIWTDGLGHRLEDYKWTQDEPTPPLRCTTRAFRVCTRSAMPARSSGRYMVERVRRRAIRKAIRHRLGAVEPR